MTRDEFKLGCWASGYCSPSQAVEYMGDREEFTEDDFIEVYRRYNGHYHTQSVTRMRADREMQGRLANNDKEQ